MLGRHSYGHMSVYYFLCIIFTKWWLKSIKQKEMSRSDPKMVILSKPIVRYLHKHLTSRCNLVSPLSTWDNWAHILSILNFFRIQVFCSCFYFTYFTKRNQYFLLNLLLPLYSPEEIPLILWYHVHFNVKARDKYYFWRHLFFFNKSWIFFLDFSWIPRLHN